MWEIMAIGVVGSFFLLKAILKSFALLFSFDSATASPKSVLAVKLLIPFVVEDTLTVTVLI